MFAASKLRGGGYTRLHFFSKKTVNKFVNCNDRHEEKS